MADRRQNRRNNSNKDEDYNPKFRKMIKAKYYQEELLEPVQNIKEI